MHKITMTMPTNNPSSVVYNVDALEFMKGLPDKSFALTIADPPYGLGKKLVSGGTWANRYKKHGAAWDRKLSKEYFDEIFRVSENWIIFGGNFYTEYIPPHRCFICWRKPWMSGMVTMSNCELALTSFDIVSRCVDFNKESGDRIHVCQKPIALYDWLLSTYYSGGGAIFDPFLGSGSSRIAAYRLGIPFVACETDKVYYEAQEERFKRACLGESTAPHNGTVVTQLSLF